MADNATTTMDRETVDPEKDPRMADLDIEDFADDSDYGWAMFLGFLCAVLSITLVVCVLTLVNSWWMLGVAIATHVTITTMMVRMIIHSMRDAAGARRARAIEARAKAFEAAHA